MTLNRFSKLPQVNIRQTQVLPDFSIIDNSIQRQQKSYDTQAATVAAANQQASQLNLHGEYANGIKEKLVQDLKAKTNEWSNQDLADPRVKSQVNGYIQNVAADPELNKHIKVASIKQEFDKRTNELKSKGKLNPSQELLRKLPWSEYEKNGTVSNELAEPLYEGQNLIQGRSELVSMIKSSGGSGTKFLNDIAYKTSSKGVDITKLDKAVQAQLHTYANSIYGRQERDDWKAGILTGEIPKTMKFEDYLIKQIKSTTDNFAHMDYDSDYASAHNANAKKKAEEETILTGSEGFNNTLIPANMKFNPDGSIREQNTISSSLFGTWFGGQELTEESKSLPENQQVLLASKAHGLTPQAYAEKFGKKQSIPVWNYVKDSKRTDLTNLLSKNGAGLINSAPIIDKAGNVSTLKDLLVSQHGELSTEELVELSKNMQVTGKVDPSAISADGYRISMGGNDYVLDLTSSLAQKVQAGKASKEEQSKLTAHMENKYKAGYVEPVKTAEGDAVYYWNEDTNSVDIKLLN